MRSVVSQTEIEDLFEILGSNLPVGVCIIQDEKFRYINPNFLIYTGYREDELLGKDFLTIVIPEDREMARENATKMLKEEPASPYQFRVACKDGSSKWVMGAVRSVQYHGREAILAIYRDITERKQAEEALCESEERYRKLASSITDVFFAMDYNLRYTYWNKASEILTGIREEDALGKSLLEIFPDTPGIRKAEKVYRDVLRTQQSQTFLTDYTDRDGRYYIFEISTYPSRDGISVFVRDVTGRKQMQEQHKLFAEHSMDIIYCLRLKDEHYIYLSPAVERMLGYTAQEALALQTKDVLTQESYEKQKSEMLEDLENGVLQRTLQLEAVHKDGHIVPIEVHASFISDETGQPVEIVGIVRDITERKQQELEYKTIIQTTVDGFLLVDMQGRFLEVNDAYSRLIGYGPDELLMMNISDIEVIEKPGETAARIARIRDVGRDHFETHHKRKDGSIIDVEVSVNYLKVGGGRLVSFIRDITERKQAEEALRESEEKYRLLSENASDIIWTADMNLRYTYVSPSVERLLGYTPEELTSLTVGKTLTPASLELAMRIFQGELAVEQLEQKDSERTRTIESELVCKDGSTVWVEVKMAFLRDEAGHPTGILGIARDITERKQAEEALRQSEENYRALFDSAVIGTIVLDAETMKVLIANQAAAKIFGFSSVEEALESDPFDFILPEDKGRVSELAEKALFEQNAQLTYDLRILTKDGRQRWISATGARIVHQGRLAGLISFTDITKQKRQSEQLMLADRLASIGELAAGAAHELNNPLTSVIGFSQLLMDKDIPDDIREDLEIIYSEAQRAAGVTKNLLAFARKHRPVKQLNQINSIIEDVLKLRTYEHKIKGIEVEKQLASDLPESMVDHFQLQQVFFNIVINAEYFMTEAHDRGTLTIATENHNGTMRISFADDGPGIPLENLSQIFNPFFTTKQTGKGTGLGLSICHGVVSEHGGQIYAKSQPGEGTTIFVELPINGHR